MNFIRFRGTLINVDKIQEVTQVLGDVYIKYSNNSFEVSYSDCEPNELIDLIEATLHKAKRLEIASRIFGHIHQSFLGKCDGETIRKESLVMAEELIKQNEKME